MSRQDDSNLKDALGAMGIKDCAWMLKWSGGTASGYGPLKMNYERYVSQEAKEEIFGINFPASGNSRLSVIKER
ncbi:hypothetical protein PIB30_077973 [Stylosanthes scabra]|uniref:Uncharacterized protein n=1 Tax=Stylosanthes scabra TaxID=79078 RepID=A0ABU6URF6_9FABA|nr:hypothetical protein [Stylosanthes scabra]